MSMLKKLRSFRSKRKVALRRGKDFKRRIAASRKVKIDLLSDKETEWLSNACLTDEQKREIDAVWKSRYPSEVQMTYVYHQYYYQATGVFSPNYIPDDLFYNIIDRQWNNNIQGNILDNKCLYGRYFPDVRRPIDIAVRINKTWLDGSYRPLNEDALRDVLSLEKEVIVKRAVYSWGGKGVFFLKDDALSDEALKLASSISGDIVIQRLIQQHKVLAEFNPASVNTIRHVTYLSNGNAKVYSSILRMGANGSRVDNACSGGITCGITPSGRLNPIAFSPDGRHYYCHPSSGIHFEDITVPSFQESVAFAESLHRSFPMFKLIAWDIAIDEAGHPVLIEANLKQGELDFLQLNNGPLFGEEQDKILSEIKWEMPDLNLYWY